MWNSSSCCHTSKTSTCVSSYVPRPPQLIIPVLISLFAFSSVVFIDQTPECRGSSSIGHQFDMQLSVPAASSMESMRRWRSQNSQVLLSKWKKSSAAASQVSNRNSRSQSDDWEREFLFHRASICAGASEREPTAIGTLAPQVAHWLRLHSSRRRPQVASDTTRHSAVASASCTPL